MTDNVSFGDYLSRNARLVILRELADWPDGRVNEIDIQKRLDDFAYKRSRDWVRTQFRAMAELGAITITEAGTVMIASITRAGIDHVERRSVIEGIARPSPEV
jgi:hypothetical protein